MEGFTHRCAKNIPELPGNYYSAREVIEELIKHYGYGS